MAVSLKEHRSLVPSCWFNIVPLLKRRWNLQPPPVLDPLTGDGVDVKRLSRFLPKELVKQEIFSGEYSSEQYVPIPSEVRELYEQFRPTPLLRARALERHLKLKNVQILYKREDLNEIGSYKLNSSFVQAFYAKKQGISELIADTGPGNWGVGMSLACKRFGVPLTIYMEEENFRSKARKVAAMREYGAKVLPISTAEGTIAASLSVAIRHVLRGKDNRLSLGCLTAYSALHNSVIGCELASQLRELRCVPAAVVGVVGGGSSFSGTVFPLLHEFGEKTRFLAIESTRIPSFTCGEYRYENPDTLALMPRIKMYTLGNRFAPQAGKASGLNYHGKNPLLSLLVHLRKIVPHAYDEEEACSLQELFYNLEGVKPAYESCFAILGAIEEAKRLNGKKGTVVFTLTGNAEKFNC